MSSGRLAPYQNLTWNHPQRWWSKEVLRNSKPLPEKKRISGTHFDGRKSQWSTNSTWRSQRILSNSACEQTHAVPQKKRGVTVISPRVRLMITPAKHSTGWITYCARKVRTNSGSPVTAGGSILYFLLELPTLLANRAGENKERIIQVTLTASASGLVKHLAVITCNNYLDVTWMSKATMKL